MLGCVGIGMSSAPVGRGYVPPVRQKFSASHASWLKSSPMSRWPGTPQGKGHRWDDREDAAHPPPHPVIQRRFTGIVKPQGARNAS